MKPSLRSRLGICGYVAPLMLMPLLLTVSADGKLFREEASKRDRRRVEFGPGERLLLEQRWSEASEFYANEKGEELWNGIQRVWDGHASKGQPEQAKFRFRLLTFFFENVDFDSFSPRDGRLHQVFPQIVRQYKDVEKQLPEMERKHVLDFSHMELYETTKSRWWHRTDAGLSHIYEALRANPESIPALVALQSALHGMWDTRSSTRGAARPFATSRIAKLTLARDACRCVLHRDRLEYDLVRDILTEAWPLAPSNEQKAMLLYGAAKAKAWMVGLDRGGETRKSALVTAAQVYEQFPRTKYAAEARVLAVTLFPIWQVPRAGAPSSGLPPEGPQTALAFFRQLQKKGREQQAGLDRALLHIATYPGDGRDPDQCVALLHELVRDYPHTLSACEAMLKLAELYAGKGDAAKQGEWLKKCAEFDKAKVAKADLPRIEDIRSSAIPRLACWHQQREQWEQSLHWWQKWEPRSWCGT